MNVSRVLGQRMVPGKAGGGGAAPTAHAFERAEKGAEQQKISDHTTVSQDLLASTTC